MKEICFVTGNRHKVDEAEKILKNTKVVMKDIGYPEIQDTLENVAGWGAKHAYKKLGRPLIVEDSGLFVEKCDGFPGPYSSYVHQKIGNKGILRILGDASGRDSYFKSVVTYKDNRNKKTFIGKVHGEITFEIKGERGFGYDPIFTPKNSTKTFGEMDIETKNKYSHRRRALKQLDRWLYNKKD
ncbi:XTP/dITP diphosphatase [Methanonatronarchaeum sp. AMET6-2]|uniref:XTP/dITP diphosphatase n=1 Tax=Methanonatronarchaeum sp. AMET6-2 TaxID=2933293 RepID=UPI001206D074|nr:XTP/dITP diphosphatase [Methanonatronarchaeum sp. AMET6-2]RZN60830.1 MAG: XTP/dITP diphosphatase [Methanonatronarchaeia archaeon]UOY09525.1 XTP/dITP diphosphatase [Methanonatronarchaeum sp. AMET6-2]